jgi:hypothetical protein
MRLIAIICALVLMADTAQARCVVLLHGLARTETSFALMEAALEAEGWRVVRPADAASAGHVTVELSHLERIGAGIDLNE